MIGQTFEVRRHLINRASGTIDIVDDRGRLISGTIVGAHRFHVAANVDHEDFRMAIWFTELAPGPSQYRVVAIGEAFLDSTLKVFYTGLGTWWWDSEVVR